MKRGFTLVELLVVVAMIAVLGGALTTSVSQSRKRAQIAKATQDAKEITNAILAYQNYAPNRSLENEAKNSWMPATKANLAMILGGGKTAAGRFRCSTTRSSRATRSATRGGAPTNS